MVKIYTLADRINKTKEYLLNETREDSYRIAGKESKQLNMALNYFKREMWYDQVNDIALGDLLKFFKKPYRKKGMPEVDWKDYRIKMESSECYSKSFSIKIFNDGRYTLHLCHKKGKNYAPLATITSDPQEKAIMVNQIQGVKDEQRENFVRTNLSPIYWTYVLLTLKVDFAIKNNIPEVRVLPKDKASWAVVTAKPRYYRQYDMTALDLGFEAVVDGNVGDIEFTDSGKINKDVDYYRLDTKQLQNDTSLLHPELMEMGIMASCFDIKEAHRR